MWWLWIYVVETTLLTKWFVEKMRIFNWLKNQIFQPVEKYYFPFKVKGKPKFSTG